MHVCDQSPFNADFARHFTAGDPGVGSCIVLSTGRPGREAAIEQRAKSGGRKAWVRRSVGAEVQEKCQPKRIRRITIRRLGQYDLKGLNYHD